MAFTTSRPEQSNLGEPSQSPARALAGSSGLLEATNLSHPTLLEFIATLAS